MRKIHVTRPIFQDSGPQGHFFAKKKHIFRYGLGSVCTKFQVCIFFRCGQKAPYRHTNRHTYLQVKMGISLTGCSPPVDFDYPKILRKSLIFYGTKLPWKKIELPSLVVSNNRGDNLSVFYFPSPPFFIPHTPL